MTSTHPGLHTIGEALNQGVEERTTTLNRVIEQEADIALLCALALDSIAEYPSEEWRNRLDGIRDSVIESTSRLLFESWDHITTARYLLENEGAKDAPLI